MRCQQRWGRPSSSYRPHSLVGGRRICFCMPTLTEGGVCTLPVVMAEAEAKEEVDVRLWGRQRMMTAAYMREDEDSGRRDAGGQDWEHWAGNY